MAIKSWCGKRCSECANPCKADKDMSCSPDCVNLYPDGSRNRKACDEANCDAIEVIVYKGIHFDEFEETDEGIWAEMCASCAAKYADKLEHELDDGGTACGCCSVQGCENTGNDHEVKHYYVDLDSAYVEYLEVS